MKKIEKKNVFFDWFENIDLKRRVKSICKPCWEIKYCPYGPLVENFPLAKDEKDPRHCRIFGHYCPVFFLAEPFTETKKLRTVSRKISRPTQFRVLKRDNQICRKCCRPIADEDIHFDHIIPWSKGGSSDEHNIQLLCSRCNLQKNANFEKEYLVNNFFDHVKEPFDVELISILKKLLEFAHLHKKDENCFPDAIALVNTFNNGEEDTLAEDLAGIIADFAEFFSSLRPKKITAKLFKALKFRWGFLDCSVYSLESIAKKNDVDISDLLSTEIFFIESLGWQVSLTPRLRKKWLKM